MTTMTEPITLLLAHVHGIIMSALYVTTHTQMCTYVQKTITVTHVHVPRVVVHMILHLFHSVHCNLIFQIQD